MIKIHRTCRDVTHLLLQSQDRPLRPMESLSLRLHWLICENCRLFRTQQRLMRVALDRWRGYRDSDGDGDGSASDGNR